VVLFGIYWCLSFHYKNLNFTIFQIKRDETFLDAGAFKEIFFASLVALICSILWLYVTNFRLITRSLHLIRATKRYGDQDVWDFIFNSPRGETEYLNLRDFEKKLTYAGWVESFSESEKQREIVLRDVIVYDFEGNTIFETERVYLARKADDIDIEFPYRAPDEKGKSNGK
jgi:hypothetical protein